MQGEPCPLCGQRFPVAVIEAHAWSCTGESTNEGGKSVKVQPPSFNPATSAAHC